MNRAADRPPALNTDLNTPPPAFAALTPPEAAATLARLEREAAARGDQPLAEALQLARRLALARPYLRHDPDCAHSAPRGVGATRCTCGLERALSAGTTGSK